ncbi:multicopper oxidase domain-containing protein [Hydrogenivirga sp.]
MTEGLSRSSGSLGTTDRGWKDTVKMSHSFGSRQIYLLHCHILEHHDAGMMVQYSVDA